MISEEHLRHWLSEIQYSLNGLRNELNKREFSDTKIVRVNDQVFSFEYSREKINTISGTIQCIEDDIVSD